MVRKSFKACVLRRVSQADGPRGSAAAAAADSDAGKYMPRKSFVVFFAIAWLIPAFASAHEVYVLDHATVLRDVAAVSPNPLLAFFSNTYQFFLWGFISFVTVSTLFFASIFRVFESALDPFFWRLKKYAAPVARVTLGLALICCAYNSALFGPELPFSDFVGHAYVPLVYSALYIAGVLIALGWLTRIAALAMLPIFALALHHYGFYMLNYTNYLGEMLFVFVLGGGFLSLDGAGAHHIPEATRRFIRWIEPYSFLILRILFGVAIAYAAIYAKFIHSQLALDTISQYHLTDFFHFEPLFTVLGALIIETLIGLFFIVGVEIRWTALFFLFWLVLSLLYFGEAVWPHLILIGLNITFFLHGYDRYSLEGRFFKRHGIEPVL